MSFLNLKEFKEELSQAVNELVDDNSASVNEAAATVDSEDVVIPNVDTLIADDEMVNTFDSDDIEMETSAAESLGYESNLDMATLNELIKADKEDKQTKKDKKDKKESKKDIPKETKKEKVQEQPVMDRLDEEVRNVEAVKNEMRTSRSDVTIPSDDVAEITKGMTIEGNITSDGSINVNGKVKGDIKCSGKLIISGTVVGVSSAAEVYTSDSKVSGDVISEGSVKVGSSSVIIGNVYGTSAVIGGAVKGDIDVKGPVIVDGTAVVQGNIRSRSVQINNGAVIEGTISQCYAEVDYDALFDKTFTE